MTTHIQILPIGDDIQQLTIPITSGLFDVDEVILLTPEVTDGSDGKRVVGSRESNTELDLQQRATRVIRRTLEDHAIPIKEIDQLNYSDYPDVYETAITLFRARSTDEQVAVNVSSLPQSAAIAFGAAATAIWAEDPERGNRIQIYSVPSDRNLGLEAYDRFQDIQEYLERFQDLLSRFDRGLDEVIFSRLVAPVDDDLESIQESLEALDEMIPERVRDDDQYTELRDRCDTLLGEIKHAFTVANFRLLREEDADPPAYHYDPEIVDDLQSTVSKIESEFEVQEDPINDICTRLEDLRDDLDELWEVRNWFQDFRQESEFVVADIGSFAHDFIEDVQHYGMHRPRRASAAEERIVSCPLPPTRDLRDMERLIVYALDRHESFTAVSDLAEGITKVVFEHAFDPFGTSDSESVLRSETNAQLETLFEARDRDTVLAELRDQIYERLRNRIQYNLESLEDSGYVIRARDEEDKRRTRTELSQTGRLWALSHDLETVCEDPIAELVASEVEKYTDGINH